MGSKSQRPGDRDIQPDRLKSNRNLQDEEAHLQTQLQNLRAEQQRLETQRLLEEELGNIWVQLCNLLEKFHGRGLKSKIRCLVCPSSHAGRNTLLSIEPAMLQEQNRKREEARYQQRRLFVRMHHVSETARKKTLTNGPPGMS